MKTSNDENSSINASTIKSFLNCHIYPNIKTLTHKDKNK